MSYTEVSATPISLPFEFKQINPSDFTDGFKVVEKTILTPDVNGYLGNQLRESINLEETNTVVINAAVGQGKSFECINIASEYLSMVDDNGNTKYVVLFIAPFKSLINQYEKRLITKGIAASNIFNYSSLDKSADNLQSISKLPIHILTINTLIGNHGEEGFIQSPVKREYIKAIIKHCEVTRKKVIFIFDEMHESTHVFKEKFIFNLWKWSYLLHKSFILSATYTESSKVIIKYLAELTEDKIQIIETERIKHPEQSRLHLCLNNSFSYKEDDENIALLIEEECKKGRMVHILCFSEKLATKIATPIIQQDSEPIYSRIGAILIDYFTEINLCTGSQQNRFNEDKCNVGTTFKTGVSIENANVSFFIITPHLGAYDENFNKYFGIFSDGINSIIQSIARVRKGNNDIFIVMPTPKKLIKDCINDWDYIRNTLNVTDFRKVAKSNDYADYHSLDSQSQLLHHFYGGVICGFTYPGIENFNNRYMYGEHRNPSKPRLEFTTEDLFILEEGDTYLASGYEIFGADISAYIVWAAYKNQFINTTLHSVYFEETIELKEGEIIEGLFAIYYKKFEEFYRYNDEYISEKMFYDQFYEYVTSTLKVIVKRANGQKEKASKSSLIRKGIVTITQFIKKDNYKFDKLIYPKGQFKKNRKLRIANEYFIDKEMYLSSAISNSINDLALKQTLDNAERLRVKCYQAFYEHLCELKKIIVFTDSTNRKLIPKREFFIRHNLISDELLLALLKDVKNIRETDAFIGHDTFSFCQWIDRINIEQVHLNVNAKGRIIVKLIDEIRTVFFTTKKTSILSTETVNNELGYVCNLTRQPFKILEESNLENVNGVNLIYSSNTPWLESYVSQEFKIAIDKVI